MPDVITKQSDDFAQWYNDVVLQAELADYSPVKGSMIIRPYGYRIWELLQAELDRRIKEMGVENAYFPLLIPESFLIKEAKHIKGFAPQVAWVTHGGKKKLEERLAIRPTSETIMYDTFSKWIQSYRDLPLKINQWANVVRWEMRTRLFLRTLEFLWQEGHTVHASKEEADEMAKQALIMYRDVMENVLAISITPGRKSDGEKFAGADYTLSTEALMKDGKALQMGTSHQLGQNFAQAFDISYLDADGKQQRPWQTSWGVSTRLIGGIIMAHGDDSGLRLPPAIAPYQVVIIPITDDATVIEHAETVQQTLRDQGLRVKMDARDDKRPGWKFNEWELKGVPLRVEIGGKEIEDKKLTVVRRDLGERESIGYDDASTTLVAMLDEMQKAMLDESRTFTQHHTKIVTTFDELETAVQTGYAQGIWCGKEKCEHTIKEKTKATLRVIINNDARGQCSICGEEGTQEALFARAY